MFQSYLDPSSAPTLDGKVMPASLESLRSCQIRWSAKLIVASSTTYIGPASSTRTLTIVRLVSMYYTFEIIRAPTVCIFGQTICYHETGRASTYDNVVIAVE